MRVKGLVLAFAIVFGSSLSAEASSITWQFNGVVTGYVPGSILPQIYNIGTAVSFVATFDLQAPDLCGEPGAGLYQFAGGRVNVPGSQYQAAANFLEVNNPGGNCIGAGNTQGPQDNSLRFIDFGSAPFYSATLGLTGPAGIAEALSAETPLPSYFFLNYACVVCNNYIVGEITEVTEVAAVPEPATSVLLGTGIAAVWMRRRRMRAGRANLR